jgi:Bacterial Ig-like domain (group 1)
MLSTDYIRRPTLVPTHLYQVRCQPWYVTGLRGIVVVFCLFAMASCRPTIIGPTQPSGYRLTLPEASQTLRMQPLTLTVRVTDVSGTPVDDVPVHFRIPPDLQRIAEISPPTVTTRQGQASATFRARTAGYVVVEVTVEDLTQAVRIAVLGDSPRF